MRQLFGIIAALIGGYLLWMAFKFGRVLLILKDEQVGGSLTVLALVFGGVGLAFLMLGWWLFRKPRAEPTAPPAATPPPVAPPPAA